MDTTRIKHSLSSLLEPEQIHSVDHSPELVAALGDCVPRVSARPTTRRQAAALMAWAREQDLAVIPRGAGTKLAVGNRPKRGDLFLETTLLEPGLEPMPEDLVVRVAAGTRLVELQDRLGTDGLRLAIDPPDATAATIGGLVATNSFGPLHSGFGTLRDMVLGLEVITPDGMSTRSGGDVVKNVTGYDLPKLHVGGLGTLGLITELTLRLAPLPAASLGLTRPYATPHDAWEDCRAIRHSGRIEPQAMEIFSREAVDGFEQPYVLWLHFEGTPDSVAARFQAARSTLTHGAGASRELAGPDSRSLGSRLAQGRSVATPGNGLLVGRVAARPSQIGELLGHLEALRADLARQTSLFISPASGLLDVRVEDAADLTIGSAPISTFAQRVAQCRARLFLLASPLGLHEEIDAMGGRTGTLPLMQALKHVFDPTATLNPGRHIGGL